ncbi:MAG: amidohydrolase family protein [Acidobacteria bacterium]|nr:amidohydrolase family protein [Acidobacteriota bacterium]
MKKALAILFTFAFAFIPGAAGAQETQSVSVPAEVVYYPDAVIHNAKIVTMDDAGPNQSPGTVVEAMAIRKGEILALGSSQAILKYAGPKTKRLDLKGRTIIPGIINAHLHIHDQALTEWLVKNPEKAREAVGVFAVRGSNPEELKHRIEVVLKENVKSLGPGKWAFVNLPTDRQGTGTGLGTTFLLDRPITQQELDQWAPQNPVIVAAHPSYLINSRAKEMLKKIYGLEPNLDESHHDGFSPMGVEYRRSAVVDTYFATKVDLLGEIILEGLKKAAAQGMTSFSSHITGINNFNAYMYLLRKYGRLPIRFAFSTYAGFQPNPEGASGFYFRLGDRAGLGNEFFWETGVGVSNLDSGPPMICTSIDLPPEQKKNEWCRTAPGTAHHQAIYDILVSGSRLALGHNYGDKTADYFMDLAEKAIAEEPGITLDYVRSRRITMDHCGLYPRPDQLPRMRKLGIMLSCGVDVFDRTYPWLEKVYGMDKAEWVSPLKNIVNAGVPVAWETEFGLENGIFSRFSPFITRLNAQGKIVASDQAVDRVTVMKMATSWGAPFILKDGVLGMLKPGYGADFVVLNQDYFTVPLDQLDRTIPLMTVVGGEVVFLRDSLAKENGLEPVGTQFQYSFERQ